MPHPKLSTQEIDDAIKQLSGWELKDGMLHREYKFADFVGAFGFMAAAALTAETLEHHPAWSNVYNRVTIDLTTHDSGGVTMSDVKLASKFEELAAKLLP